MYVNIIITTTILFIFLLIILNIKIDYNSFKKDIGYKISRAINTYISKQENKYRLQMIKNEMNPLLYKYNLLMSRLKMEIVFLKGFTLFQFKWVIYIFSFLVSIIINVTVFRNIILEPILYIICLVFIICAIFSFTIKNRLQRIIDCINTENILAANIDKGFLADVKLNINSIPISIRDSYQQYITNIELLNFSSREALSILDLDTGKFSTDFLSNVNIYENNRVEGFVNTFKDIAELNNIKKLARNTMDNLVQKISKDFSIAILISYGSFILELVLCKFLLDFYFKHTIGQILILIDLIIAAFVYLSINILKSQEL